VVALRRVRFGPLALGDLAAGAHRRLTRDEVERLRRAAARR
jgi:23S rRNA pseudouridine2605 synthase